MGQWQMIAVTLALILLNYQPCFSHPDASQLENKEDAALTDKTSEKRSVIRGLVWHLLNMAGLVKCATGRKGSDYNGYGCWCGLGGSGQPVDPTDRCCMIHDKCYDRMIARRTCGWWLTRRVAVYYKTYKRRWCTYCLPQRRQRGWTRRSRNCKYQKCRCDVEMAKCFRAHKNTFNNRYKNYDKKRFCR